MPSAVMPDVHGDGAPLGILMVKKDKPLILCKCNKDVNREYGRNENTARN